jgi:hypothetical protein
MASLNEYRRRCLVPLIGVGLLLYYVFGFLPLARRAASLDTPLQQGWQKLSAALDQTNAASIDFRQITNALNETRSYLAILDTAKKQAMARFELAPALRAKLGAPFQLVDYQNERSSQMDRLDTQAKAQQVTIDPAVFSGFPEHTADLTEPSVLWAALSLTGDLLSTAIGCKVTAVHYLEVSLPLTNSAAADGTAGWAEIPIQIELTASGGSLSKLLGSLPRRADELGAAGLPAAPKDKAPLLIDRTIMKKVSPDKLDEVRVWLVVVGFVPRE